MAQPEVAGGIRREEAPSGVAPTEVERSRRVAAQEEKVKM